MSVPLPAPLAALAEKLGGYAPDGTAVSASPVSVERLTAPSVTIESTELPGILQDLYSKALRARSGRERAWFEQLHFFCGEQYGEWNDAWKRMDFARRQPKWLIRETWNEIGPTIEHAVAINTRDAPVFSAQAGDAEGSDESASEAGDATIEYLQRSLRAARLRRATRELEYVTGTAAWVPEWDAGEGRYIPMQPGDLSGLTGDGMATVKPEGDVRINLYSGFELLPSPCATSEEDIEYLFTIREVDVSWARSAFPDYADKIVSEPLDASGMDEGIHYLRQYQDIGRELGYTTGGGELRDSTRLVTCYVPASLSFPNGRMFIMVGKCVVYVGENPVYPANPASPRPRRRCPVFVFRNRWSGKSFWGRSMVAPMIPLQRQLNGLVSKSTAIIHATLRPIIVTRPGVKIDDNPCPVIYTDGGNTPPSEMIHVAQAPNYPVAIMQKIDRVIAEIQRIGGIQDATRGISPGADASGVQVQSLQEQDASRLGPVKKDDDETEAEAWRYILQIVSEQWTVERLVLTIGSDQEVNIQALKGSNIAAGTDVFVVHDQGLPTNRAAAWTLVTQLAQSGFLNPQNTAHQQLVFRMLRIGGGKQALARLSSDESRARRVVERMKRGVPQQAAFYDDAAVHVRVVTEFMKTNAWETLAQKDPQIKALFEQYLAAQLSTQATNAATAAVPGPGSAPPPGALPMPGATADAPSEPTPEGVPAG